MTQQTLAERAKLSVEAIGALERGARTRPYRDTIALLARALELSAENEALFEESVGAAQPPRRRERANVLQPSLLRIVHPAKALTPRHNLPQQLTSFVGRQNAVGTITTLLKERRLVTIVGAGGVGKTRIAIETASGVFDDHPDGVWIIDLVPLVDQNLVPSAVLAALQIPSAGGSTLDSVLEYLETRRLLLILDNCEHVIAAARDLAGTVLASCPAVRILATSRQTLSVTGEDIYRLPSLAVPPASCRSQQDAIRCGAVELFADRAVTADPSFALTDANAGDITEICRRLDRDSAGDRTGRRAHKRAPA